MNEFVTDMEDASKTANERITSSAKAVGAACLEAGDELSSVLERGRIICKTVRRRVDSEVNAANVFLHQHPYPPVLMGIAAGAVLGYLVASRLNGRTG